MFAKYTSIVCYPFSRAPDSWLSTRSEPPLWQMIDMGISWLRPQPRRRFGTHRLFNLQRPHFACKRARVRDIVVELRLCGLWQREQVWRGDGEEKLPFCAARAKRHWAHEQKGPSEYVHRGNAPPMRTHHKKGVALQHAAVMPNEPAATPVGP